MSIEYTLKKRTFWKGNKDKKTSLSLPSTMYDALNTIADDYGMTLPDVICTVLDDYLVDAAARGTISLPGEQSTTKNLTVLKNEKQKRRA